MTNIAMADGSYAAEETEKPIGSAVALTQSDSTTSPTGRTLAIVCTVAGNVKVSFPDASTLSVPVAVGLTLLPWAVTRAWVTGTTATATFANLG